jgi:hypothetical protein
MHVHVHHADGEAKFWLEPEIALAQNYGLPDHAIREAEKLVMAHRKEICDAWHQHFAT